MRLVPYKAYSQSAKNLAEALGIKRQKTLHLLKPGMKAIHWGLTPPVPDGVISFNSPASVLEVSNKLTFFKKELGDASTYRPKAWFEISDIPESVFDDGGSVFCRTVLSGHSGDGIVDATSPDGLVKSSLYVKYIPKEAEYRVHLLRGNVLYVQKKIAKKGSVSSFKIRTHKEGFFFVRTGFEIPDAVVNAAQAVFSKFSLDFGAVDVIYTKSGKAFVLEINTAPGLEGKSVVDYAEGFKKAFF